MTQTRRDRLAAYTAGWQAARHYDPEPTHERESARMHSSAAEYVDALEKFEVSLITGERNKPDGRD